MSVVSVAADAVSLAAVVCRAVQSELEHVRAITKDDASPVTVADFASQAVVAHVLTSRLGPVRLVAEESSAFLRNPEHATHLAAAIDAARLVLPGLKAEAFLELIDVGAAAPAPGEPFWTLDPIDGTKGFLRGEQYAVALASINNGRVALGAMACPNLDGSLVSSLARDGIRGCVVSAVRGEGVTLHVETEAAEIESSVGRRGPLAPHVPARLAESVEKAHTSHDVSAELMKRAGPVAEPVRLDSQCKYACLALGAADAYLRLPSKKGYVEKIWDHAAGALIAEEAGCIVSDVHGTPLDFSRGRELSANRGIVAAAAGLHGRLIDAARDLGL